MHHRPPPAAAAAAPGRFAGGPLGLSSVAFCIVAGAAPLTAMLSNVPVAEQGAGYAAPAAYLIATAASTIFSVGYIAMSRRVTSAGGRSTFVSRGLDRILGVGTGLLVGHPRCPGVGVRHEPAKADVLGWHPGDDALPREARSAFTPRGGLVLHRVAYAGRPIVHRASLAEMYVPPGRARRAGSGRRRPGPARSPTLASRCTMRPVCVEHFPQVGAVDERRVDVEPAVAVTEVALLQRCSGTAAARPSAPRNGKPGARVTADCSSGTSSATTRSSAGAGRHRIG